MLLKYMWTNHGSMPEWGKKHLYLALFMVILHQLAGNENQLIEQFGIWHRFVLSSVSDQDIGIYSWSAENDLGKSRSFIELSGINLNLYDKNIELTITDLDVP